MRHATLVLAALTLLAVPAFAETDAEWSAAPAIKVGDRVLTRADIGRRLLHSFGMRVLRGRIFHEQLRQAVAAKKLTVDPAAVETQRKAVLADIEKQSVDVETFLQRARITREAFDRDVWNLVAGDVLARKVGIRPNELPNYLALNFPARGSEDPNDPILVTIGETKISLRPLVEGLLPFIDPASRNRFLEGVTSGEGVELAIAGKITEPTDEDIKKLEAQARAKILKVSQGRRTLEMVLAGQKQSLAAYRRSLRRGERIRRAILAETDEKELKEHFDRWKVFFQGHMVRVSHILVRCAESATEKEVEEAMAKVSAAKLRIDDGEAFATVASELSHDSASRLRGGDLGFIPRKSPLIAEAFASAAFELEKGEMSKPVRTRVGFHLILATDLRPGRDVDFDEVRAEVARDFADSRSVAWIARSREGLTAEVVWGDLKVRAPGGEKGESGEK